MNRLRRLFDMTNKSKVIRLETPINHSFEAPAELTPILVALGRDSAEAEIFGKIANDAFGELFWNVSTIRMDALKYLRLHCLKAAETYDAVALDCSEILEAIEKGKVNER